MNVLQRSNKYMQLIVSGLLIFNQPTAKNKYVSSLFVVLAYLSVLSVNKTLKGLTVGI